MRKVLRKLIHPPEYPDEIPSRKGRFAYWLFWHFRLTDMGRGQVFGKFTQLFTEAGLFMLLIDKLGYANLSLLVIGIVAVAGAFLVWFAGWLFVILGGDIIQQILNRYRDVMFKDMYNVINKKNKGGKNRT